MKQESSVDNNIDLHHPGISKFSWRFAVYMVILLSFMVFILSSFWYLEQGIRIPAITRATTHVSFMDCISPHTEFSLC